LRAGMSAERSKKLFLIGVTAPGKILINALVRGFVEGSVMPPIKRTISNNGRAIRFNELLSAVRDGRGVLPETIVLTMASGAKGRTANLPASTIAHFCAVVEGLRSVLTMHWPELLLGSKIGTAAFYAVFAAINGGDEETRRVSELFASTVQIDASHLVQPDTLPGVGLEACETRFETHADNSNRIACRVLCEKQRVACCVCGAQVRCKFWSHFPKAALFVVEH